MTFVVIRPEHTSVTFKLNASGTEAAQTIIAEGSPHIINVDATPRFGGKDAYPSPLSYVLSSLLSCSQVTAQLVANDLGITLHSFEFNLKANLDTAVLFEGAAEGNPNFQNISIKARIDFKEKQKGDALYTSCSRAAASTSGVSGYVRRHKPGRIKHLF